MFSISSFPCKQSNIVQLKMMSYILLSSEIHYYPSCVSPFCSAICDMKAMGTKVTISVGTE